MCPVFTATAEVTDQEDEGIPEVPQQPSHSTVSSQWEDPSLWDHSYGEQQGVEETAEDATTQTEDFSYSMLQGDADSFLYTGVSLETSDQIEIESCAW